MSIFSYSEWDGTQDLFDLDQDELMDELARNLMYDGDMAYSLWKMQRHGMRDSQGRRLPGLQDLIQRLRQRRQGQLEKYNLSSVMDEIRKKLEDVLKTEREGIQKRLEEARQKTAEGRQETEGLDSEMQEKLLKQLEDMAAQNLEKLDNLPSDIGGQIKELTDYDFMDAEAQQKFQELIEMLKQHAMQSYSQELTQRIKDMDPESLAAMRHLIEAINQMLEQRMRGEEPDFEKFMEQFGDFFGPEPPQSLDELIERLQKQMAQAQSLLDSMSPKDRQALDDLLRSMLDEATQYELAKLSANLETLYPSDRLRQRYHFTGEESISYTEALKLMEMLQQMDNLDSQLRESQFSHSLDDIDEDAVREFLGDEAAEDLERLRNITRALEEAGYIQRKGSGYELTPRGIRKIGQKALKDVFSQLKKDHLGLHSTNRRGIGTELIDETKQYEFGDPFNLNLQKTIMNSIMREQTLPVKLTPDDFEVFQSEEMTRSATVLMLDLSLSMPMRGNFQAAKQMAIALDGLIRTQYPRDTLHIIGFSSYARMMKKEDLPYLGWDEFDPYTNIQQGFQLARKLLSKERCSNKQILLVSDGEPTAHIEQGQIYFQYPPSLRTIQLTMREVKYCTKQDIVINTFMLGESQYLNAFVTQMARLNKGRVFFTSADTLGEYILVDYMSNKRKHLE
ncbi:MAG TPA: VWA domain-containing protein [Dehalococcoidia bacterium]|nr:VWA domain-containing protein [Dehalococcoidia bacterium]